jgi:hypothetical protein
MSRLLDDSRLAQPTKLSPPITLPTSSVRQQLFHFDPSQVQSMSDAAAVPIPKSGSDQSSMLTIPYRSQENNGSGNSIGTGIVGRSVARTIKLKFPERGDDVSSDGRIRSLGGIRRAPIGSDERAKEVALRNLFPGFF